MYVNRLKIQRYLIISYNKKKKGERETEEVG